MTKIVQNHLGTHQEHREGVFDDTGAVSWTPGSRSMWDPVVKTEWLLNFKGRYLEI